MFATAFGPDLDERQRVVFGLTEQERPSPLASRLGLEEHLVDRRNHGLARTVVGVQAVQPPGGSTSGGEVGINVGAAEGVDRLLGVANHEQPGFRAVLGNLVDPLEDAVLDRVGVLEFVNQCYRELLTNQAGQALAGLASQGMLQP
ncbi:hypothetical protein D3C81_1142640 [compost metagenome]